MTHQHRHRQSEAQLKSPPPSPQSAAYTWGEARILEEDAYVTRLDEDVLRLSEGVLALRSYTKIKGIQKEDLSWVTRLGQGLGFG